MFNVHVIGVSVWWKTLPCREHKFDWKQKPPKIRLNPTSLYALLGTKTGASWYNVCYCSVPRKERKKSKRINLIATGQGYKTPTKLGQILLLEQLPSPVKFVQGLSCLVTNGNEYASDSQVAVGKDDFITYPWVCFPSNIPTKDDHYFLPWNCLSR